MKALLQKYRCAFNKFPDFLYRYLKLSWTLENSDILAIHLMRWLTNFYDFRFKWTATAAIGIRHTKAWLSQLINFKNVIRKWELFRIKFHFKRGKNVTDTYGMLKTALDPSWWIEHQFLWDSRKVGSLWGMMRGEGGVRKKEHQSW